MNEIEKLKEELRIAKTHAAADFEEMRAKSLNVMRQVADDLRTINIALTRPVPKVSSCRHLTATTWDDVSQHITHLESLK